MNIANIKYVLNNIKSEYWRAKCRLYDGFSLGLAEADVLGKPVVSTNIPGTGAFVKKYGGTLVENSEEGIYYGLRLLFGGKVELMNIDYDVYNAECLEEFEKIFD